MQDMKRWPGRRGVAAAAVVWSARSRAASVNPRPEVPGGPHGLRAVRLARDPEAAQ